MHQHLQEGEIVAGGAIEAATAHEKFGLLRDSELDRIKPAVSLARMDGHQSFLLIRSDDEVGVLHAERLENVLAQIDVETLSADRLDRLAGEVDVDAILPAIARIECERRRQGRVLAAYDARKIVDFDILSGVGIPEVVCEPGR